MPQSDISIFVLLTQDIFLMGSLWYVYILGAIPMLNFLSTKAITFNGSCLIKIK